MLTDARGVEIEAGDTVIWGFGVGRSVAMAEGVVVGCDCNDRDCRSGVERGVSLTASGRVRIRVVRRSCDSGEKPVVDVAPDRFIVLKDWDGGRPALPPSPLPTQADEALVKIGKSVEYHTECLRATVAPDYWVRDSNGDEDAALVEYLAYHNNQLAIERRKLRALDEAE